MLTPGGNHRAKFGQLAFIALLVCAVVLSFVGMASPVLTDQTPLGIRILIPERNKITGYLANLTARGLLDETRPRYEKVHSAFNAWVAEVKGVIKQDHTIVREDFPWGRLNQALTECKAFADYAQAALPDIYPPLGDGGVDEIANVAEQQKRYVAEFSLRMGARVLWEEYREASPEHRKKLEELIADLAL